MDRIYPGEGGGIWFHTILNAQGKFFHSLVAYKWGQASPAAQRFFFAKNWSQEMEKFWPKVNWIVKGDGVPKFNQSYSNLFELKLHVL